MEYFILKIEKNFFFVYFQYLHVKKAPTEVKSKFLFSPFLKNPET